MFDWQCGQTRHERERDQLRAPVTDQMTAWSARVLELDGSFVQLVHGITVHLGAARVCLEDGGCAEGSGRILKSKMTIEGLTEGAALSV